MLDSRVSRVTVLGASALVLGGALIGAPAASAATDLTPTAAPTATATATAAATATATATTAPTTAPTTAAARVPSVKPTVKPTAKPTAKPTVKPAAPVDRDRAPHASRSMRGVLPSTYVGKYYNPKFEKTRLCIVRRESGGNYAVRSARGSYQGAYQMSSAFSRMAAGKIGRPDLRNVPASRWGRYEQDKAFWTIFNNGKGRGHWAGGSHPC